MFWACGSKLLSLSGLVSSEKSSRQHCLHTLKSGKQSCSQQDHYCVGPPKGAKYPGSGVTQEAKGVGLSLLTPASPRQGSLPKSMGTYTPARPGSPPRLCHYQQ